MLIEFRCPKCGSIQIRSSDASDRYDGAGDGTNKYRCGSCSSLLDGDRILSGAFDVPNGVIDMKEVVEEHMNLFRIMKDELHALHGKPHERGESNPLRHEPTIGQLFSRAMNPYGSVIQVSSLADSDRFLFQGVKELAVLRSLDSGIRVSTIDSRAPRSERVHVGFVDNASANSIVVIDQGVYLVGVFHGLVASIFRGLTGCFGSMAVFDDVGRPGAVGMEHLSRHSLAAKQEIGDRMLTGVGPTDVERQQLASSLAWVVASWFLVHEQSHVFRGHLDWLMERLGARSFKEFGDERVIRVGPSVTQCFELDADYAAVAAVVDSLAENLIDDPRLAARDGSQPESRDFWLCRFAFFVLSMVCLYLAEFAPVKGDIALASHPNCRIRWTMALIWAEERLSDLYAVSLADLARARVTALRDVEGAVRALGVDSFLALIDGDTELLRYEQDWLFRIQRTWEDLREHVKIDVT